MIGDALTSLNLLRSVRALAARAESPADPSTGALRREEFTRLLADALRRARSYSAIGAAQSAGSSSASLARPALGLLAQRADPFSGQGSQLADLLLGWRGLAIHQGESSNMQRPSSLASPYATLVTEAAGSYGLDPALIAGIIEVESGFNPAAVSSAGAKGLMQLMDATARSLGVSDPFDARQNIFGGSRLLRQLLDRHGGHVHLALAAYNAGSGAVEQHGGIPPYAETQRFVPKVLEAAERFRREPTTR